jgi:hypothetical protein
MAASSDQAMASVDVDPKVAAAFAAWATELAIQVTRTRGEQVPGWAGTVVELLDDWSQQLGPGGRTAGQAGTARTPGVLQAPVRLGVLAGGVMPAAPPSVNPLLTWLRLRVGLRRCLACGHLGNRNLQPAHPLVPPARARTWACVDRLSCRRQRRQRHEPDLAEMVG